MPRHNLVAYQLFKLRKRNLQRSIDLIGRFVLRSAVCVPCPPDVVHRTGKPRVLDGQEVDVRSRHRRKFLGKVRQQILRAEIVKVRDHGRAQSAHRGHRDHALPAPGIHCLQQPARMGRSVPAAAQQFVNTISLCFRFGGFRRLRCRRLDAAGVRHRIALAQDLHGQVPHRFHTISQPGQIGLTQSANLSRLFADSGDSLGKVHLAQVLLHCLPIDAFARHAAGLPQTRRRRMRVGSGQRLIGKPGIGDEAPRARGTHHVTAPERVDA